MEIHNLVKYVVTSTLMLLSLAIGAPGGNALIDDGVKSEAHDGVIHFLSEAKKKDSLGINLEDLEKPLYDATPGEDGIKNNGHLSRFMSKTEPTKRIGLRFGNPGARWQKTLWASGNHGAKPAPPKAKSGGKKSFIPKRYQLPSTLFYGKRSRPPWAYGKRTGS